MMQKTFIQYYCILSQWQIQRLLCRRFKGLILQIVTENGPKYTCFMKNFGSGPEGGGLEAHPHPVNLPLFQHSKYILHSTDLQTLLFWLWVWQFETHTTPPSSASTFFHNISVILKAMNQINQFYLEIYFEYLPPCTLYCMAAMPMAWQAEVIRWSMFTGWSSVSTWSKSSTQQFSQCSLYSGYVFIITTMNRPILG